MKVAFSPGRGGINNIQKLYVEMDAGMDDYLSKPILFETLQAAIDR